MKGCRATIMMRIILDCILNRFRTNQFQGNSSSLHKAHCAVKVLMRNLLPVESITDKVKTNCILQLGTPCLSHSVKDLNS